METVNFAKKAIIFNSSCYFSVWAFSWALDVP